MNFGLHLYENIFTLNNNILRTVCIYTLILMLTRQNTMYLSLNVWHFCFRPLWIVVSFKFDVFIERHKRDRTKKKKDELHNEISHSKLNLNNTNIVLQIHLKLLGKWQTKDYSIDKWLDLCNSQNNIGNTVLYCL